MEWGMVTTQRARRLGASRGDQHDGHQPPTLHPSL